LRLSHLQYDREALPLGQQILDSLRAAGIHAVDVLGGMGIVQGFTFGVRVAGPDTQLTRALISALGRAARLQVSGEGDGDTFARAQLTMPGAPDIAGAAASIFIGNKPPDAHSR